MGTSVHIAQRGSFEPLQCLWPCPQLFPCADRDQGQILVGPSTGLSPFQTSPRGRESLQMSGAARQMEQSSPSTPYLQSNNVRQDISEPSSAYSSHHLVDLPHCYSDRSRMEFSSAHIGEIASIQNLKSIPLQDHRNDGHWPYLTRSNPQQDSSNDSPIAIFTGLAA